MFESKTLPNQGPQLNPGDIVTWKSSRYGWVTGTVNALTVRAKWEYKQIPSKELGGKPSWVHIRNGNIEKASVSTEDKTDSNGRVVLYSYSVSINPANLTLVKKADLQTNNLT